MADVEDLDLLIEDYIEGRLSPESKASFEERMKRDGELRSRFDSATRSVEMVQQALGWIAPGDEFDEKVNSKIIDITQSGQNLRPYIASNDRNLTSEDPDAKLLGDPEAIRERRRLIALGVVAAVLFLLAAGAIGYSISKGLQKNSAQPTQPK
jgi:hypothetical protein